MDEAFLHKLTEVANTIHRKTVNNKANYLMVEIGSPFHMAIERGEFIWMGLDPEGTTNEHQD